MDAKTPPESPTAGAAPGTVHVTFFKDVKAKSYTTDCLTLVELRQRMLNIEEPHKGKLPLLKLAVFGDKRSDKGSLRHDDNLLHITGIELEHDDEKISFDHARNALREINIKAMIYTTASHTSATPRWRILAPTSQPCSPEMREKLVAWLNGCLKQKLGVDRIVASDESFTLSQAYYYGFVKDAPDHKAEVIDGDFIDLRDDLVLYEALGAKADDDIGNQPQQEEGPDQDEYSYGGFENILSKIGDGPGLNRFHKVLRGAAMSYARTHCRVVDWDRKKLKARMQDAIDKAPKKPTRPASDIKRYKGDKYLDGIIQGAIDKIKADPEIHELNEKYALVRIGGKVTVMVFENDTQFTLLDIAAFKQWYANRDVKIGRRTVPLAAHWLSHPQRRQYKGIGFWPNAAAPVGYYNLWRGFAVNPVKGHCAKFLHHLKVNVCRRNKQHYRMVIGWLAQLVQQPAVKIGTSLVLRGEQGTGKTKVGKIVGALFPDHYKLVSAPHLITGRFNAHLKATLLLHADEAFWAGDHAAEGRLKDLVTNDKQNIEFKGKEMIEVGNYVRLLITGNAEWQVPAGYGERRFFVFDMGEEHTKDFKYFAAIDAEMDNGGREALLYHLLNIDLSKINLRDIPQTKALLDQQIATMTPEQGFWYDPLSRGTLPAGCEEARSCPADHLFERYLQKATRQGARRRSLQTQFGTFLHKHVPGLMKTKLTYRRVGEHGYGFDERGPVYIFPPLKECRAAFAKKMKQSIAWDDPDADWVIEGTEVEAVEAVEAAEAADRAAFALPFAEKLNLKQK
jgi:hypothetical protein